MTYSELYEIIYTWISQQTNLKVIYDDQNGVRPDKSYISFKLINFTQMGNKEPGIPDNITGIRPVKIHEDFTLNIRSFGMDTINEIQKIKNNLELETTIEYFSSSGISSSKSTPSITDISILIDNVIEKRFLLELTMGFVHVIEEETGIIETIEYNSDFKQPN